MTLRVVYVDHVAQLSGGEIALVRLLEAVGDRVEAHVVLAEDGPLVEQLEAAGATVHVLPMAAELREVRKDAVGGGRPDPRALLHLVRYAWRLSRLVRSLDADVVHTNSLKAALYGGAAGRLARRPVVWHVRDRIETDYLPRPAVLLVRSLERVLASGLLANSRATLATVPHRAVSAVLYDPLPAAAVRETRPAWGAGPVRIGVVGRLTRWKGQHVFLEAFARAFPDGEATAVVVGSAMFGEDAYADSLLDQAARLGIADRVDFRGFRDDVWAELAGLDVLVHCSVTPEPFGQVIVEGMAAGVPVIAARAGGPAEIVTDGVDGLLVAPDDVPALARAMRRLVDDPDLAGRLVTGARASVVRFAPERAAEVLLGLYAELLD